MNIFSQKPSIAKISNVVGLCLFLTLAFSSTTLAQVSVTFKVNLKPQLKDSTFVPNRDQIYLKGDTFPLTTQGKVYLKDVAPTDSVFQTTVEFPVSSVNQTLNYNFFITTPNKTLKEQMPRQLKLQKGKTELDALYFDTFAW